MAPFKVASGLIINNRFKILKPIGRGSFGGIYCAADLESRQKVAIKFEHNFLKRHDIRLDLEHHLYQLLNGDKELGFARCFGYYYFEYRPFLVLERFYKNLNELFELCNRSFTLKTVLYISIQAISRIETLHKKKDVKPENFMVGFPGTPSAKIIHLIDFGLIKEYRDTNQGQHIDQSNKKSVTGTVTYMSRNAHFNMEQSRRDDLESLSYMLLYLLKGKLPWSFAIDHVLYRNPIEQAKKIGSMKEALTPEQLFEGFPSEFAEVLSYARALEFDQEPDYEMIRAKFHQLFTKLDIENDYNLCWEECPQFNIEKKQANRYNFHGRS